VPACSLSLHAHLCKTLDAAAWTSWHRSTTAAAAAGIVLLAVVWVLAIKSSSSLSHHQLAHAARPRKEVDRQTRCRFCLLLCSGGIPQQRPTSSYRAWREREQARHVATEERQRCMRRVEALDRELSGRGRVQQPEAAALSAVKQDENFALENQRAAAVRVAEECDVTVALEEAKFAQWRKENMRRKHDYVPFAVKLLDLLAEKTSMTWSSR
ncbi:unnamed protein product, partial [Ectocarpus sp. 13 AM-2016]